MRLEGNFGQINNNNNRPPQFSPEEMKVRLSIDEIRGQLMSTAYAAALEKFNSGDLSDKEYLMTYQRNLLDWKNGILQELKKSGTHNRTNEEILNEINYRLGLVSDALIEDEERVLH